MRSILVIAVLLLAVGSLAATVDVAVPSRVPSPIAEPQLEWVRTSEGWQRPATWNTAERFVPRLHPSVVAGLLGLASLWVLAAFPTKPSTAGKRLSSAKCAK